MAESVRRGSKRPKLDGKFWLRVLFFCSNIFFICIVYRVDSSVLYTNKDAGLEAFLWISLIANWIFYLSLQGSDPGYIIPGQELFPPPTGASRDPTAHAEPAPVDDMTTVQLDIPHEMHRIDVPVDNARLLDLQGMDADPDFDDSSANSQSAIDVAKAGQRVCKVCHARQPARAHHCRKCNRCVHTFDHHCAFLGVCIGERNRCRFWFYLFTQVLVLAVVIGILNTGLVWRRTTGDWIFANILALLSLIVLWILQLCAFGLLCFHSWLAATNGTTFEVVTGASKLWYLAGTDPQECDLPYSRGLCGNLKNFCCMFDTWYYMCRRDRSRPWTPKVWEYPGTFERDSTDVCNNLWENRFWSCC